jgi:hypothetical protein
VRSQTVRRLSRLGQNGPGVTGLVALLFWLSLTVRATGSPPLNGSARPAPQYMIRKAEITISVADAERFSTALQEVARTVRGSLQDQRMTTVVSDGRREMRVTLVLPPEMVDTALARLRGMALAVSTEQTESHDVSSQVNELNERLAQLRATRRQLQNLMEQATTDSDRRQVQTALAQVETEISDAEATLMALRQEADWAVVRILAIEALPTPTPRPTATSSPTPTITPIPITPSPTPWRPIETVNQATDTLVSLVQKLTDALILGAVIGGPFLVVIGLGWWILAHVRS